MTRHTCRSRTRPLFWRRHRLSTTLALLTAAVLPVVTASPTIAQQEPIKVGVLHSLSGTMAISETPPERSGPHGY